MPCSRPSSGNGPCRDVLHFALRAGSQLPSIPGSHRTGLVGPGGLSYPRCMTLIIDEAELRQLPLTSDPGVVSGALVFRGTRVPVDALIENLEAGLGLDEFLDNFPTVSREQAVQVLEHWRRTLRRLSKAS